MLKLFVFLSPFRGSVALVLALALAQSLASLYLPRLMADIVDHGIVPSDTRQILIYGALMLLMALVSTAASVASSFFSAEDRQRLRPRRPQPDLRSRRALLGPPVRPASAPRR